jgi:hypothetical protein
MMISQTTHDTIDEKSVTETCRRRVFVGACDILHTQSRNFIPLSTHPGYTLTEGAISHFRNWRFVRFTIYFVLSRALAWALICATNTQDPFNSCQIRSLWKSLSSNERQEMTSGYNKFTVRRAHTLRGAARRLGGDASKQLLALP